MATRFILGSRAQGSLSGGPLHPPVPELGGWGGVGSRSKGRGVGARPRHHPPAATAEQPQSSSSRAQLPMAGQRRERVG